MNSFKEFVNDTISEHIEHKDGKWIVTNKSGTKVLGTHDSEKQAQKQLAAIEISKKIHS